MMEAGKYFETDKGTPQGGILSPVPAESALAGRRAAHWAHLVRREEPRADRTCIGGRFSVLLKAPSI